VLPQAH